MSSEKKRRPELNSMSFAIASADLCAARTSHLNRHVGAVATVFSPCYLATLSPQQHTNGPLTET